LKSPAEALDLLLPAVNKSFFATTVEFALAALVRMMQRLSGLPLLQIAMMRRFGIVPSAMKRRAAEE